MFRSIPLTAVLSLFLLLPPALASAEGQVNTFIYHRFDETRYPSTNISSAILVKQLDYLQKNNYTVISLGEVARRLQAGEALPEKGAALCIDDAFTSFAEIALPLFRQYGYPVTLFVNTDAVGTPGYLDWSELQKLLQEGVEIGSHTATHAYLIELQEGEEFSAWRKRVKADIAKAQQELKEHLGIQAEIFAYPYGEYTPEVVQIVREVGFVAAFAQQSGVIHENSDPFLLPRFPMGGPYATLEGFVSKLRMKPLKVVAEEPQSPVVMDNPPELQLQIADDRVSLTNMNCFVQGDNSCTVSKISERPGWYRVVADKPLAGRRNKYTLTAQGKRGGWHWYSHLWVRGDNPVGAE